MEVYWVLYLMVSVGTFIGAFTFRNTQEWVFVEIINKMFLGVIWPVYISTLLVIKLEQK